MKHIFNRQLAVPLFLILFGLLFFAIGSGLTYRQRNLETQGMEAPGVVVALDESSGSDGSTYAPVVRFSTSNGQRVEFTTSYYSSPPDYEVGESVTVIYRPEQPEKAVIKGDGQLFHIIFMLVGGVVVAVGLFSTYSTLRNSIAFQPGG
jgi:hypothetical protein